AIVLGTVCVAAGSPTGGAGYATWRVTSSVGLLALADAAGAGRVGAGRTWVVPLAVAERSDVIATRADGDLGIGVGTAVPVGRTGPVGVFAIGAGTAARAGADGDFAIGAGTAARTAPLVDSGLPRVGVASGRI